MFLYDDKVYIKTCGTTTLLKAVSRILELAASCNLEVVDDLFYSRQNFFFPEHQLHPHTCFEDEVSYLDKRFRNGEAFVVGRVNGNHYNFYNAEADDTGREADSSLEVMMTDLDPDLMRRHFYQDTFTSDTLHNSGIGYMNAASHINRQTDRRVHEPVNASLECYLDS